MQILLWLFKNANETNININSSKKEDVNDQKVKSKEIIQFGISPKKRRAGKLARSSCKIFNILRRKDIAADYFYSTIHLKRLENSRRKQHFVHCIKMKKQSLSRELSFHRKADSAKVLPITDAVTTQRNGKEQSSSAEKKEKAKEDKIKTISKMKELIRWAAAAKSEKRGKYFGRKLCDRSVLKAVPNENSTNKSPLNSTLVHINQCPAAARKGNWITTDSECKRP